MKDLSNRERQTLWRSMQLSSRRGRLASGTSSETPAHRAKDIGKNVLVVDDNAAGRELVRESLKDYVSPN
jgi:hypothetical protein